MDDELEEPWALEQDDAAVLMRAFGMALKLRLEREREPADPPTAQELAEFERRMAMVREMAKMLFRRGWR